MQRKTVFFNPVDLEAGLYTMKIVGISPRVGSNNIDLCMEIKTAPITKLQKEYGGQIIFYTINTMKIEHTRGIYVDVVISPTVFNGELFNEFTQFSYSDDINYSEYDRTDKEQ